MKFNKDGRVQKLIPFLLVLTLISALFVYYTFAGIATTSLNGPVNNTWVSNGTWLSTRTLLNPAVGYANVSFNCTAVTNAGEALANVSLYIAAARSAGLVFNSTNQTAATNDTGTIINVSYLAQGEYWWTCAGANHSDNKTWALNNYTLWVDWTPPHTINLSNALLIQGYNSSVNDLAFNWTAFDNLATTFLCNLTLHGIPNATIMVSNGSLNNTNVADIPDGNHEWNVTCWDPTNMSSNVNQSLETRRLRVDTTAPSSIVPEIANNTNFSSSSVY
ncbi:MAG: hypothetical protein QME12_09535, partial [Nanoarchaeota archaeon]|nr:hypothetical protein [Nanoarchaeota archaeon]